MTSVLHTEGRQFKYTILWDRIGQICRDPPLFYMYTLILLDSSLCLKLCIRYFQEQKEIFFKKEYF